MAISAGIVHMDCQGGEAAWIFVDEERWNQIKDVPMHKDWAGTYLWTEIVTWLALEAPEVYRKPEFPNRKGHILHTVHTQSPCIKTDLDTIAPGNFLGNAIIILGIVTLPAW